MSIRSFAQIKTIVSENDGVYTFSMQELRDATGKNKLGIHVVNEISRSLKKIGLAHYPAKLPSYQHLQVRVYEADSVAAQLINAVSSFDEGSNEIIRSLSNNQAIEILNEVRKLVCSKSAKTG